MLSQIKIFRNFEMKFFGFLATFALANDEYPHDPDAMEYCQGMPGGYYPHPEECGSYYVCWNYGEL